MRDDKYIKEFYNEIEQALEGEHKIILETNRKIKEDWVEYDQVKWELEESIQNEVKNLLNECSLNFEEKVLKIYEFICLNYIYDINVLYFFKKDASDINNIKYIAVDWYGRIIDEKWKENRKKHNRRVCYEFARFYAKAINVLLAEREDCEAFMVGEKDNTHYVVGLTGKDYSVILDLDDFNSIKDLTRLKLGLTIKGIKIIRDDTGKFKNAVDAFNKNKKDELTEIEEAKQNYKDKDAIKYFNNVIEILKNYNIDSQGFCEYLRAIIENEGIEVEKIWKEIKDDNEKRYERCLIFEFDSKAYLLDSVNKTLNETNIEEIDRNIFIFNPEENEYSYYGG